ncbi:HPP family protein [Colwellia sp. E2M01]|uniref:HPP family protein n=1 Tax=Colwellia sp. E2M01 TaxID=2841561 RepID=UPI001C0886D6|nr:HPP family protein [Colwellia sp. E2M01]MBU2871544.1 HPP family protein [Colwellia sp. E2M01]
MTFNLNLKNKKKIRYIFSEARKYLGIEENSTSHLEKILSGIGAMISIYLCQLLMAPYIEQPSSLLIIGSMGASATLVYALPHGALSQPWHVFGGHLVSALVGILCYQHITDPLLSGAVAVGGAVLAMYFLRCLHPPGGATALFCTQGGEYVYNLGFSFIWDPLLPSVLIIIGIGVLFNAPFSWRRYPAHLNFSKVSSQQSVNSLSHEDVSAALLQLDSFVDISTEELALIFDRALVHSVANKPKKKQELKPNHFYSNGSLGESWNIKQITSIEKAKVHFKIIAGKGKGLMKVGNQSSFQKWAKFEVELFQGNWIKKSL